MQSISRRHRDTAPGSGVSLLPPLTTASRYGCSTGSNAILKDMSSTSAMAPTSRTMELRNTALSMHFILNGALFLKLPLM